MQLFQFPAVHCYM